MAAAMLALAIHAYHDRMGHLPTSHFGGKFGVGPDSRAWRRSADFVSPRSAFASRLTARFD